MIEIPDETLMAYADDELAPADRALIDARLAESATLRARLEAFTATRTPLAEVFARPMREPVPERLLAAVYQGAAAESRMPGLLRRLTGVAAGNWGMALAFGLMLLVIGGAGGWQMRGRSGPDQPLVHLKGGALVATGALGIALETQVADSGSAAATALGDGRMLRFRSSFLTETQACREYEISTADGEGSYAGYACRSDDGAWRINFHGALASTSSGAAGQFTPAAGGGPPALDAAIERIRKGDVLDTAAERELITRKWRVQP